MFFGMPQVHDWHGPRKVFGHQAPDPGRSIPQGHQLVRPLKAMGDGQRVEQLAKVFRFRAASHIVFWPGLIHKHPGGPPGAFWPAGGLKDCTDFDFPIHIPLALAFLLLHGHTTSSQPGEYPLQFDLQPLNALLLVSLAWLAGGVCLAGLVPQGTDLLIFLLLESFAQRLEQIQRWAC
jgi:hypothetical protein